MEEQSGRKIGSANSTTGAQHATFQGRSLCAEIPFEQLAIAASHHPDRVFYETDRLTADGGCFPRITRDGLGAVERVGDLTIGRVSEVSVEGADHQGETLAVTPGDLPGFWQGTGGTPGQTSLEADEAENANPKIIVQRQQGCELLICSNAAKPQVVIARRVLDDDMGAVGADCARPSSSRDRRRQVLEPSDSSQAQ